MGGWVIFINGEAAEDVKDVLKGVNNYKDIPHTSAASISDIERTCSGLLYKLPNFKNPSLQAF